MHLSTFYFRSYQWIFVHFLVYLQFVKVESRWNALSRFNSTHGFECVTPCEKRDQNIYGCYIAEQKYSDDDGNWDYCSPRPGRTYKNEMCTGPCGIYANFHTKQYRCATTSSWDYCGKIISIPENPYLLKYITKNGQQCINECKKRGFDRSWCNIDDDSVSSHWNYCSVDPFHDIYGNECENTCGYHGRSSMSCILKIGLRSSCGSQTMSSETHYTTLGSKCVTDCSVVYHGHGNYKNQCNDATGRKRRCSIAPGVTVDNRRCLTHWTIPDNRDTKDLYWCETSGKCSIVGPVWHAPEERGLLAPRQWPRKDHFQIPQVPLDILQTGQRDNVYNLVDDLGNFEVTFYEQVPQPRAPYSVNRTDIRNWAFDTLNAWAQRGFSTSPQNSARLGIGGTERNGVRLDQQGRITRNGVVYLNLQLQVNGITPGELGGRSTTISAVTVQEEVMEHAPRRVRDALVRSMFQGYTINIGRFQYNRTSTNRGRGT